MFISQASIDLLEAMLAEKLQMIESSESVDSSEMQMYNTYCTHCFDSECTDPICQEHCLEEGCHCMEEDSDDEDPYFLNYLDARDDCSYYDVYEESSYFDHLCDEEAEKESIYEQECY